MAKVELDEEDVRRYSALEKTVGSLWANPEARLLIQKAQKLVDPKAATPDLDRQAQVNAPVEALQKEFKEYVEKTEGERAEERKNARLSELSKIQDDGFKALRRQKYTDDGLAAVKKLMDEKGILDPLDAAAIFERNNPPQTPVTPGGTGGAWNFTELPTDGGDFVKKLIESKGANDLIPDREAWSAINEARGVARH